MKLIFTYNAITDENNVAQPRARYALRLPNAALRLDNCRDRVLGLARAIGQLTQASLTLSCVEFKLRQWKINVHPIDEIIAEAEFQSSLLLHFTRQTYYHVEQRQLKIFAPVDCPPPTIPQQTKHWGKQALENILIRGTAVRGQPLDQRRYLEMITSIADTCLELLNTEPVSEQTRAWVFQGFYPYWTDEVAKTRPEREPTESGAQL